MSETTAFCFRGPKAQEIVEALGLPPRTLSINIDMQANEFVKITCTYVPDDLDELVPLLKTLAVTPTGRDEPS